MRILTFLPTALLALLLSACSSENSQLGTQLSSEQKAEAKVLLGKQLFFDVSLSEPAGQSCASCHSPAHGFADPNQGQPVSAGVVEGKFTGRNTPTAAYASLSPALHFDEKEGLYVGGQFWDGRANTLEEQAAGPLTSPAEMNNADEGAVVKKVQAGGYADKFNAIYGDDALQGQDAFVHIVDAIAAFERSPELNPFTSKYDAYLAGKAQLTEEEALGLKLFEDEKKGNCAACHISQPGPKGEPPLFTDFTYDNLGLPANPVAQVLSGDNAIDLGLGKTVAKDSENGKFKVSTLRNIELTPPYMHNGFFDDLTDLTQFYNRRDVSSKWGEPEYPATMNKEELGHLHMSDEEVAAIVAFMKTLTDGYQVE